MNGYAAICLAGLLMAGWGWSQPDPRQVAAMPGERSPGMLSEAVEEGPSLAEIRQAELARRQELETRAAAAIDLARESLAPPRGGERAPDYERARDLLVAAEVDLRQASVAKPSVLERLQEAQALLEITYSKWAESLVTRGDRLAQLKQYTEAIRHYQAALDLCPEVKPSVTPRLKKSQSAIEREEFRRQVNSVLQ